MSTRQNSYSVSDLNNRIKSLLDSDPALSEIAVRGEISNYKVYPSGHHYFTLKDKTSSIRCVMFKGYAGKLRFQPENGMGAIIFGSVSVYPRDGAYQLYCLSITPEGQGDLHAAFEQLKEKLSKEGLFNSEHKKLLPRFPEKIAVITSSAGAAIRDILRILDKRWPLSSVIILPVRVQGTEAPFEISGAINYANQFKVADVIITGRGGGSIEDLWAFNDEKVARAIFASEIPIISAVGHEPDVTISDYVADLRAATPSNAAELCVPDQGEMREALASVEIRLAQAMRKKLSALSSRLEELSSRRVMKSPTGYIDSKRMELDFIRSRLSGACARYVSIKRQNFIRLASSLDALSPLKVLGRGYSVATNQDGRIIKSLEQIDIGSILCLRLGDGTAKCQVHETLKENAVFYESPG